MVRRVSPVQVLPAGDPQGHGPEAKAAAFPRRTLTVARQVQRAPGGAIDLRAPKYGSERQVYLAPSLVDLPARHVAAYFPEGNWIFTGETGEPPHQNTVGDRWRTTLALAGLTGVKLHDLRHFYASGLIASGCGEPKAAERSPPRDRAALACRTGWCLRRRRGRTAKAGSAASWQR